MIQEGISAVYESELDALRSAVAALGGKKVIAARLWPAKPVEVAARELADALNPERDRKLELHEATRILRWARDAGFHAAKHFFDHAAGYEHSSPRAPEEEKAHAVRDLREQLASMQAQMARLADALALDDKLPSALRVLK
jgi:hypothetical protein